MESIPNKLLYLLYGSDISSLGNGVQVSLKLCLKCWYCIMLPFYLLLIWFYGWDSVIVVLGIHCEYWSLFLLSFTYLSQSHRIWILYQEVQETPWMGHLAVARGTFSDTQRDTRTRTREFRNTSSPNCMFWDCWRECGEHSQPWKYVSTASSVLKDSFYGIKESKA